MMTRVPRVNISQRVTPRAQTSEAGEKMLSVRASTASHLQELGRSHLSLTYLT